MPYRAVRRPGFRIRPQTVALLCLLGACSGAEIANESQGNAGNGGSGSTSSSKDGGPQSKSGAGGTSNAGSAGKAAGGAGQTGGGTAGQTGGGAAGQTGGSAGQTGGGAGTGTGGAAGAAAAGGTAGSDAGASADCKRGVAYGRHSEADMRVLSPAVSWWYNWAYTPDSGVRSGVYTTLGVEYVPMIWGANFNADAAVRDIPAAAKFLLGFNEPNFFSQANLSAARAAELWPQIQTIAQRRNLALVSPAVNFCGGGCHDTDPFKYLRDFLAACQGCRVDALGIHIYVGCNAGGQNKAQWLIDHVENYKRQFNKPFWLTEFACNDAATLEQQRLFMVDAVTYLEKEPRIQRYAWFSGRADNVSNASLLGSQSGQLTVLGETYVSLPRNAACRR